MPKTNNNETVPAGKLEQVRQTTTLLSSSKKDRDTLIALFLYEHDVKESSKKTYRESLSQYFSWLDLTGRRIEDVTSGDIVAYKQHLISTGHETLTVRSYLTAVRQFYKWTAGKRFFPNVADTVRAPRTDQGGKGRRFIKMHLTDAEGARLLDHFRDNPRNYAMVNLMLRTGIRTIEVSRARIKDVRVRSGRRILQVWGKGMDRPDPQVFVILTDAAWGPIRDYIAAERPDALEGEYLFVTQGLGHSGQQMSTRLIQMIIKKGLRAIGLDDHAYSAHSLRHTTATQIIKNGGSIMDVKRTLRHSSVDTSMIYTASIEEEERLRHAPEELLDNSFKNDIDNQ